MRTTLRQPTEQFDPVAQAEGPLHWGKVWRDLLDLPTLTPVLEEVIGNHAVRERRARAELPDMPTFRLDHVNVHTHVSEGFPGSSLHGGWKGTGGAQFSSYHDGRFYNGLVSVSFELYDTYPNNGGFGCIPGSHKSNLRLPESWRDLTRAVPGCVTRVPAKPGAAIGFTEGADPRHAALDITGQAPNAVLQVLAERFDVVRGLLQSGRLPRLPRHGRPQARDPGATERPLPGSADETATVWPWAEAARAAAASNHGHSGHERLPRTRDPEFPGFPMRR